MHILPKSIHNIYANVLPTALALTLSEYILTYHGSHLLICKDSRLAFQLYNELNYLLPQKNILYFTDLEILPFDYCSANENVISSRLYTLNRICNNLDSNIIIANVNTLFKYLPPKSFLQSYVFVIKKGDKLDITLKKQQLKEVGYQNVNQVISRGEFSVRGNILDIFPMGSKHPYRIDLFNDEIENIYSIDLETQLSNSSVDKVHIIPTQEFIFDQQTARNIKENWKKFVKHNSTESLVYQKITTGKSFGGIEFYLPLFFKTLNTIFDYLSKKTTIHKIYDCQLVAKKYYDHILKRHDELNHDRERPILAPQHVFLSPNKFEKLIEKFEHINWLKQYNTALKYNLNVSTLPDIHVNYQNKQPFYKLLNFLTNHSSCRIIFCAESLGKRLILCEKLSSLNFNLSIYKNFNESIKSKSKFVITVAPFIQGLVINNKAVIITEFDLFVNHIAIQNDSVTKKSDNISPHVELTDLSQLHTGSLVVHIEHGIAIFDGLTKLSLAGQNNEFLILKFKNDEKLYVPIYALYLVSLYNSGNKIENISLSKLGTDKWQKEREKSAKKIYDVAANLLAIYAERNSKKGYSNTFYEKEYLAFSAGFPFEETPDQLSSINDVIQDMISEKPMDRLVCGDVGFGKTEVAMRAAFIATSNKKQVAILTPTTLLTQQHFNNFSDRFSKTNMIVETLSRFKTSKEQNKIIEKINNGKINIIIGTYKLLSEKINFYNLGLLIIDEEHRFGVMHKEKMKSMRTNIDILTMTATPIPRTLNMAFSNIRDLSIIATPPIKRFSVKTFVKQYNNSTIKEAIMRETLRGGQVYYLHNSVDTIYQKTNDLKKLFPEIKIATAHGQMRERELEKVMFEFQKNYYQILVCTTIIETGIDIANANTIIVERADNFGLAQLHQLRGRVGRSFHQAYAYLLTPPEVSLTKNTRKRLEAILHTNSLGGGYMIASHDLEIRGAGEILGKEQSGNIQAIGFNLYMDLLKRTILGLKNGQALADAAKINQSFSTNTQIELRISAFFPEEYIFDVHIRLGFYARISHAKTHEELDKIKIEIIDRFGVLPEYAKYLFDITHLKLFSANLGIKKIDMHANGGIISFETQLPFDPTHLIKLIQEQPFDFQLSKNQKLVVKKNLRDPRERIAFIKKFTEKLYISIKNIHNAS